MSYIDQRPCEIYTLAAPGTGEVRYVGRSRDAKRRYYNHVDNARKKGRSDHRVCWIRSLIATGQLPVMVVVERCAADIWAERERYWIEHFTLMGCRLTNSNNGGVGPWDVSPETRLKLSAATARRNRARKGVPPTEIQREVWRARQRRIVGRMSADERRQYAARMVEKRKPGWNRLNRSHCPHGHAYTSENTYLRRNGVKICRACARERQRVAR